MNKSLKIYSQIVNGLLFKFKLNYKCLVRIGYKSIWKIITKAKFSLERAGKFHRNFGYSHEDKVLQILNQSFLQLLP